MRPSETLVATLEHGWATIPSRSSQGRCAVGTADGSIGGTKGISRGIMEGVRISISNDSIP